MNSKTKPKTPTIKAGMKLVGVLMPETMIDGIDTAGKAMHRTRAGQIRAMLDWLLSNKRMLNGI